MGIGSDYTDMVSLLYISLPLLLFTQVYSSSHSLARVGRGDKEKQNAEKRESGRMMGLDTGNPAADFEAGMWIAALIGTLVSAIPVAFLSPSLGFKRKRSLDDASNAVEGQDWVILRKRVQTILLSIRDNKY